MSVLDNLEAVDAKLQKELEAHRLAGFFQSPPLSPSWISPLGLVPKKVQGEFRLIHHLSFPTGFSVNDGISSDNTSVKYATIDEAIQLIKRAGPGCFLAKTDVKMHSRLSPFTLMIIVSLGCSGGGYIIMTDACQWVVPLPASLLKCLAQLWNGLLVIS